MSKKLIEMASEIVRTQLSLTPMSAADIAASLKEVFMTLQGMYKSEHEGVDFASFGIAEEPAEEESSTPKATAENSIQNDKIICLECGKEMRQLTAKHLVSHGMDQREYRKKYGFAMRTPLAAKSLTKARIKAARKRGLPENLTKFIEAKRQSKAEAAQPVPAEERPATVEKPSGLKIRKRSK
ncbi:MAG: MucR family transcriptional regulator [Syntrophobacteraceae bacterium]